MCAEELFVCGELERHDECCEQVKSVLESKGGLSSKTTRQNAKMTDLEVRSPAFCRLHHMRRRRLRRHNCWIWHGGLGKEENERVTTGGTELNRGQWGTRGGKS
jgi:hypothetical protein